MPIKITLTGRIPSKKNSKRIVRRGRFSTLLPSVEYLAWHREASNQLKNQNVVPLNGTFGITCVFYMPDNRKTDLSNKFESVADLLVDTGIVPDDSWQYMYQVNLSVAGIDKANPRVEICITPN